jgi:hypothetical protein
MCLLFFKVNGGGVPHLILYILAHNGLIESFTTHFYTMWSIHC